MTVVSRILVAFLFIIAGCFSFFIRKEKRRSRRKGKSCSCRNSQTSSEESIDSIDSMSVVEPTTWQMPPKGRKRTRTISGASNFSGVSTMSTLSEKDRMWLQAFRYAGRWEQQRNSSQRKRRFVYVCFKGKMKEIFRESEMIVRIFLTLLVVKHKNQTWLWYFNNL